MMLLFLNILTSLTFLGCTEKVPETESVCDDGVDDDLDNAVDCDDSDCASSCDVDGDGVTADEDCDDDDASIYPGATEFCDGIDNNCDDEIDNLAEGATDGTTYYSDADGDGYGFSDDSVLACNVPDGYTDTDGDCDDENAAIHPSAVEICDGIDNNCNEEIDEGVTQNFYADGDGDGVLDGEDNCVGIPNEDQADADNDGQGDACDETPNGDDRKKSCDALESAETKGNGKHKGVERAKSNNNC